MKRLNELRQERGTCVKQARDIIEKADKEKRAISAEERTEYDRLMARQEELRAEIEREEKLAEAEAELRKIPPSEDPARPPTEGDPEKRKAEETRKAEARMTLYRRFIVEGRDALSGDEWRSLQADLSIKGGNLVPPQEFLAQLIKFVDDAVFMRQFATIQRLTTAESLGVPSLDTDISDADWTSELATGNEDTAMDFGKRELRPHPLAKRIKVSQTLLRKAALNPEQIVRDRLGYKFGVTQEKAFLAGDGAQKPLGVFTASAQGISTARDVSSGNETTSIGADGIKSAKYTLKPQYWPRARWVFHRTAIEQVDKLKDGNGQYMWQPGLQVGTQDRLVGFPIQMSEFAPSTFTTGKYVGLLGDLSFYWIVDAMAATSIQRLVELYAEKNQVGFIGRAEVDGMPVLEEAFVRVKLA